MLYLYILPGLATAAGMLGTLLVAAVAGGVTHWVSRPR